MSIDMTCATHKLMNKELEELTMLIAGTAGINDEAGDGTDTCP